MNVIAIHPSKVLTYPLVFWINQEAFWNHHEVWAKKAGPTGIIPQVRCSHIVLSCLACSKTCMGQAASGLPAIHWFVEVAVKVRVRIGRKGDRRKAVGQFSRQRQGSSSVGR
jgi:hypothetical protein